MRLLRTATAAIIGGSISKATGGKFANGVVKAAFAQSFNSEKDCAADPKCSAQKEDGAILLQVDYEKVVANCSDFKCDNENVTVGWTFKQSPYQLSWQEARAINESNAAIYGAKHFLFGTFSAEVAGHYLSARVASGVSAAYGMAGFTAGPKFKFNPGDIVSTTVEIRSDSLMLNDAARITRTINMVREGQAFIFVNKNY